MVVYATFSLKINGFGVWEKKFLRSCADKVSLKK